MNQLHVFLAVSRVYSSGYRFLSPFIVGIHQIVFLILVFLSLSFEFQHSFRWLAILTFQFHQGEVSFIFHPTCVRLCNVIYFCFVSIKDKGSRSGQDQTTWTAPMYRFFKLQWVTFSRSSFVYKSYHEIYRIDRRSNVHGNITCWRHSLWSIRSLLLLSLNFQDYINHEFYVSDSFYNDMAIVKIATPGFEYWDDAIRPICLPTKPASEVVGEEGIISGWGTTETGTYTHTHILKPLHRYYTYVRFAIK